MVVNLFTSSRGRTLRRFEGKVAVVTGGASGIGEATVRRLVLEGARVVIADVQEAPGRALATELGPAAARFVRTDVSKESDVAAAVDAGAEWGNGALDVMVNNAGILGAIGAIDLLDLREYDYTLAVNLRGVVAGVKHAARVMKPAGRGAIVCTGSTAAVVGGLGPHCYTVAKRGVDGLVRSAAIELRAHGVRINLVSPDLVATRLVADALTTLPPYAAGLTVDQARELVEAQSFVKGAALTPDGVARAVAFLASDDAAYVSGHNLVLDAGRTVAQLSNGIDDWFKGRIPFIREAGIRSVEGAS